MQFKVLVVILWTKCIDPSSHTSQEGYLIDVETEKVKGNIPWYNPRYAIQNNSMDGYSIPGIKRACKTAILTHKMNPHKWCRVIGWDCMINTDGVPIFFEGNLALWRTYKHICLNNNIATSFVTALGPIQEALNTWRGRLQHFLQLLCNQKIQKVILI